MLSIVISVAIVLLSGIALVTLPVEQFPNIAPPTVEVTTSYPGANAETVLKSVIVPLEEAINGVENMTYIYSTASNAGDVYITVYFKQGTDPDMAAVNVQNRVSKAQGQLPADVTRIGVVTNKQQKSMLKAVTLWSPDDSYDTQFLNNYLQINVIPELKRITGVGEVTLLGSNYGMRIWLKPDVMAQYGIVPSDVTSALNAQNIESATGSFGENYEGVFQYTMKYKGRHGRHHLGHHHDDAGLHGRVHPRQHDGRHQRHVLHAVRSDHGGCRGHLGHQRPDALARPLQDRAGRPLRRGAGVHRQVAGASGDWLGLHDVQRQLPAIPGRSGCRQMPTGGYYGRCRAVHLGRIL